MPLKHKPLRWLIFGNFGQFCKNKFWQKLTKMVMFKFLVNVLMTVMTL